MKLLLMVLLLIFENYEVKGILHKHKDSDDITDKGNLLVKFLVMMMMKKLRMMVSKIYIRNNLKKITIYQRNFNEI